MVVFGGSGGGGGRPGNAVPLVAHQGAEISMVVLELLLEEGDGGGAVQDDPGLRRGTLAAALRAADGGDAGRSGGKGTRVCSIQTSTHTPAGEMTADRNRPRR